VPEISGSLSATKQAFRLPSMPSAVLSLYLKLLLLQGPTTRIFFARHAFYRVS